jgi:hypothetical protein
VTLLLACAGTEGPGSAPGAQAVPPARTDDLLVVDCLLPGKVRKLGQQLTYLTPRRPVKTSAADCEIRGGDYVAYDRANYATALRVWLPGAEDGDPKAQTYVGEIYEKGLGLEPDYAAAATWYRRAADQGYAPAQIDLGQLYERGLGVPLDVAEALRWYRKASGLDGTNIAFVTTGELQGLRQKAARGAEEARALRAKLEETQGQLAEARGALRRTQTEVEAQQASLERSRAALERERTEVAAEGRRLAAERQRLEAAQREGGEAAQAGIGAGVGDLLKALVESEGDLAARAQQISQQEAEVAELETAVARKREQLATLHRQVERLDRIAQDRRQDVRALTDMGDAARAAQVALAAPSIQVIDPALPRSRGVSSVTAGPGGERAVVGRVSAPGGLLALRVNDRDVRVDGSGIFRATVPLEGAVTRVELVAVDRQGKRAARRFEFRAPMSAQAEPVAARQTAPDPAAEALEGGNFYALVIGNDDYASYPKLESARADAEAVAEVLETDYGFVVTALYDATRYDILSALNQFRVNLAQDDNFLVYYAGHGELDPVNQRGYWLPVDARVDDTTNWISNTAITDLLSALPARHVMVVADSCYAGSLPGASFPRVDPGLDDADWVTWHETMAGKRSRTALTSGGLAPVPDGAAGGHSRFAAALTDVLLANDGVLSGQVLFQEVAARAALASERSAFDEQPHYAPIQYAGHESGDFFFVPGGAS